jgi:DNA-binding LytR/AlgR family response regulator
MVQNSHESPTALIAEDEPLLRAELRRALGAAWPELVVCAEAQDGFEAMRVLDTQSPDVLFLDIQLPGASGIEVARCASGRSHVVFVTAYDKYAVAAFEEGAVDYLLKPFSAQRLQTAVSRVKQRLNSAPATLDGILRALTANAPRKSYLRWVTLRRGQEVDLVTVDEVCYFQADHKYTLVYTGTQESLIRKPIKELIEELDPELFWQIHRSTLVNINAIAGISRDLRGRMRVRLKQRQESLPVGESFAHRFREL